MKESRAFLAIAVLLAVVAVLCAATGKWFGFIGSLLGSFNAIATLWFLLKWTPDATIK